MIIKVNNRKMANILIQKNNLDYILHKYMKYNFAYKINQNFNC